MFNRSRAHDLNHEDIMTQEEEMDEAPKKKTPTHLWIRIASGIVFIAVIVTAICLGSISTALLMSVMAGFASFEFFRMIKASGSYPSTAVGILAACAFPLVALVGAQYLNVVTLIMLVVLFLEYVNSSRKRVKDIADTVFGSLYIGLMLSSAVLIRSSSLDSGNDFPILLLTLGVCISTWVNDSAAYFFGSLFGSHKLSPKISPNKSWEGFFAGFIGSVIVWVLMMLIPELNLSWPVALIGGVASGFVGVVGDLVESRIKRECGFKDSGNLIPGHGGLLDRIDSFLLVLTTSYFILRIGGVI